MDEDGESWHDAVGFDKAAAIVDGGAVEVTVIVTMLLRDKAVPDVVTVTVTMSLLFGEVEPEVRLNMIIPAATWNGVWLPRVAWEQVLVDELPGPQQKDESFWNG